MNSVSCTSNSCGSSNLSAQDPLDKALLGPRPRREKVREQIRDYIHHMLGAPTVELEFDEQNVDFCIDQALMVVEDYAPNQFYQFHKFITTPGKSVYTMPPDVGFIREVSYKETGNFAFSASDLDGAIPVEYFYPGGSYASIQGGMIDPVQPIWGRMGEWALYKGYENMYSRLSSSLGGWEFNGNSSTIKLYPIPHTATKVIVRHIQKNKDWNQVSQAMQEGALSYAKEILGRVRSKFATLPGPGGGIQLDGQQLLQEAKEEREKWKEDLIYRFGDLYGPTLD